MPPLLSVEAVTKTTSRGGRDVVLLDAVSLTMAPGELVAVIASRSKGKTTLLRLAAGVELPDSGTVHFAGRDLSKLSDAEQSTILRTQIGLAGQAGPGVGLRMLDYVAAPLLVSHRRTRRRAGYKEAMAALSRVGVERHAPARWDELSMFDRALVEIAQAIVRRPRLILADDITDGLGMFECAQITRLLRSLTEDMGVAILMAASDSEAALSAHRILRISNGQLRPTGEDGDVGNNVVHLADASRASIPSTRSSLS